MTAAVHALPLRATSTMPHRGGRTPASANAFPSVRALLGWPGACDADAAREAAGQARARLLSRIDRLDACNRTRSALINDLAHSCGGALPEYLRLSIPDATAHLDACRHAAELLQLAIDGQADSGALSEAFHDCLRTFETYVSDVDACSRQLAPVIGDLLEPMFARQVCDTFVAAVRKTLNELPSLGVPLSPRQAQAFVEELSRHVDATGRLDSIGLCNAVADRGGVPRESIEALLAGESFSRALARDHGAGESDAGSASGSAAAAALPAMPRAASARPREPLRTVAAVAEALSSPEAEEPGSPDQLAWNLVKALVSAHAPRDPASPAAEQDAESHLAISRHFATLLSACDETNAHAVRESLHAAIHAAFNKAAADGLPPEPLARGAAELVELIVRSPDDPTHEDHPLGAEGDKLALLRTLGEAGASVLREPLHAALVLLPILRSTSDPGVLGARLDALGIEIQNEHRVEPDCAHAEISARDFYTFVLSTPDISEADRLLLLARARTGPLPGTSFATTCPLTASMLVRLVHRAAAPAAVKAKRFNALGFTARQARDSLDACRRAGRITYATWLVHAGALSALCPVTRSERMKMRGWWPI